ncbi:hypothetical protein EDD17DRAFT_1511117 [Pisolithus thermaeus]|nr:hypothetical protein EV401DRAFT_2195590 [Pisolithus croceorrhizus]KAI6159689.1 hypothetical protein EDD17DRAFT_1511117 [Pisolithus thermaeus]
MESEEAENVPSRDRMVSPTDGTWISSLFWLGIGTQLPRNDTARQELAWSYGRSLCITGPSPDVDLNLMHIFDTTQKLGMDKENKRKEIVVVVIPEIPGGWSGPLQNFYSFRFGTRTTSPYKAIPNENPEDVQDNFEIIGEIEWHAIGSSTLRLYGDEMKTKDFTPRHGLLRNKRVFKGPDGPLYRWEAEFSVVHLSRDGETRQKLAKSHRRNLGIIGARRDPYLEVSEELEHMLDMIVLTFIYIEKLRMDDEEAASYSL